MHVEVNGKRLSRPSCFARSATLHAQSSRLLSRAYYPRVMTFDVSRRSATVLGIGLPLLQAFRTVCYGGGVSTVLAWPIAIDAYVTGAFLLLGARAASRELPYGRFLLAAAWGFTGGIMYRTFFEQLADPDRRAGPQMLVLVVKGILLVLAFLGFVGAVRAPSATSSSRKRPRD
jgi:hypothetical protein